MHSFWQDLRYAARTLRQSPGFTIIAIVTLGLGMAVNTTIFSVINGFLLRPLPVPHAEQITVLAMKEDGAQNFQRFSYPDYLDIRQQAEVFSDVFAERTTLVGWQKRFGGDRNVVGKQVEINDHSVTIVGVAPKGFHGTFAIVDMDGFVPCAQRLAPRAALGRRCKIPGPVARSARSTC